MCEALLKIMQPELVKSRREGEEKLAKLNTVLINDNRIADLQSASNDEEYRDKLYKEFCIE